jgi:hypothetical protein
MEHREAELRFHLIQNPHDRCGDQYCASVSVWNRTKVNVQGLLAAIDPAIAAKFMSTRPIQYVRLAPVSTRRKVKAA